MKARILPGWVLGIMLAGGATAPGFAEDSSIPASAAISSNLTDAAVAPALASVTPSGGAGQSPAPETRLSPWALDVRRLVRAQVDEAVILAFVNNSPGIFNLSADHVIQFKDLGVSPEVINAMIQHDQQVLSAATPPHADTHTVAAAISWDSAPLIPDGEGYAPEQPASLGPVRAPYPVKLNDPIIILKLPSFTVPYW